MSRYAELLEKIEDQGQALADLLRECHAAISRESLHPLADHKQLGAELRKWKQYMKARWWLSSQDRAYHRILTALDKAADALDPQTIRGFDPAKGPDVQVEAIVRRSSDSDPDPVELADILSSCARYARRDKWSKRAENLDAAARLLREQKRQISDYQQSEQAIKDELNKTLVRQGELEAENRELRGKIDELRSIIDAALKSFAEYVNREK